MFYTIRVIKSGVKLLLQKSFPFLNGFWYSTVVGLERNEHIPCQLYVLLSRPEVYSESVVYKLGALGHFAPGLFLGLGEYYDILGSKIHKDFEL